MQMLVITLDGKEVVRYHASQGFEWNGVQYPPFFFEHMTTEELEERGWEVIEVPDPVFSPPPISRRQFFHGLALQNKITKEEAIAAITVGTLPAAFEQFLTPLPEDQEFNARMLLIGAQEFQRTHPLTAQLAQVNEWDDGEVDAFFEFCRSL